MNDFFQQVVQKQLPTSKLKSAKTISGGCINNTYKLETTEGTLFLKWNSGDVSRMFDCEMMGLKLLTKYSPIATPTVLSSGIEDGKAYLLLEWIDAGHQSHNFWQNFAYNLAAQHQATHSCFGLDHSNYIGSLEQSNRQHDSWCDFFINERLLPQLKLAESKSLVDRTLLNKFESLFAKLESLIPSEPPAFIHGDLWSGNFMCGNDGEAVIFDPAVYYGHRETELSFTHLFGGFSPEFYHYYQEAFPLEPEFDQRIELHHTFQESNKL